MTLLQTAAEDAGLLVWLPDQKVLIGGELLGKYFPPIGAITASHAPMPATRWINILTSMMHLNADVLVPLHTLPITGANVAQALGDQKAALQSVHAQTVEKINQMMSLDDIVATVQIPEPLRSSPWVQEYTGTVANAVRAIYHQYMGWFDGEVDSLNPLSQVEQSRFIVDLAGGPTNALTAARNHLQNHTMEGIQKSIIICKALHIASPSVEADKVYIEALRRMGYSQTSGQMRNYYLLTAQKLEAALPW